MRDRLVERAPSIQRALFGRRATCEPRGMDYRDERDALRARVESLESSLATAQAELERMRATEAALEASRRELQRLRSEVERLRPTQRPPQNRGLGLLIAGGGVVMLAAFGAASMLRARVDAPSLPAGDPPTFGTAVPMPAQPDPVPKPVTTARRPAPQRPEAARTAHAEWTATVTRSQGAGPPVGASCKVSADLAGDGSQAHVGELEVLCGAKFLFRSTDEFSGMSNTSSGATEEAGKTAGTLQHTLMYQDQGTRSGARSQISIDTAQRTAVIWSDNVPTFRVELRVEPASLERTGEPLIDPENRRERFTENVVRTGTITKVEGTPPLPAGAACTVDVSPAASGQSNCRVRVRCGGKLLYGDGQSGYNQCTSKEGRVGRLVDERTSADDGDPALGMDLSENTVVVSEDGDPSWTVTIGLTRAAP